MPGQTPAFAPTLPWMHWKDRYPPTLRGLSLRPRQPPGFATDSNRCQNSAQEAEVDYPRDLQHRRTVIVLSGSRDHHGHPSTWDGFASFDTPQQGFELGISGPAISCTGCQFLNASFQILLPIPQCFPGGPNMAPRRTQRLPHHPKSAPCQERPHALGAPTAPLECQGRRSRWAGGSSARVRVLRRTQSALPVPGHWGTVPFGG